MSLTEFSVPLLPKPQTVTVVVTVLDSITRTSDIRKDYGRVKLFS